MKKILFLFLSINLFSKEYTGNNNVYYQNYSNKNDIVKDYNSWKDKELNLDLRDNLRELTLLKSKGEIQQEVLNQMYKNAEYKFYIENQELRNDLVRAKIYYYYYNNYRRYYYYDINYHVNFIN